MPDPIFAEPRLAAIYDVLDDDRSDLDVYVAIAHELGARRVLDVGCGTGTLACRLSILGLDVVGVDPAAASLALARGKPGADEVRWIESGAAGVPPVDADLAVMTGNVAQVFLTDADWANALGAVRAAVRPGGWFVFETREPARRAWERWVPEATTREVALSDGGSVRTWTELTEIDPPFVSFRQVYGFDDGTVLTSDSTLRFRERDELEASLTAVSFAVHEVRDAPDRPGLELVFLCR